MNKLNITKSTSYAALVLSAILLTGCGPSYSNYYGPGRGVPYVIIDPGKIYITAYTGEGLDNHRGEIESAVLSEDGKIFTITGSLLYGNGASQASYERGLTGSATESFRRYPFSAIVDNEKQTLKIVAKLQYAGSLYNFEETLPAKK